MKKAVRVGLVALVVIVGIAGFYIYKLRTLAIIGNTIYGYRCIHVNPILIGYKKAFLGYADWINTYPNSKYTDEELKGFIDGYMNGVREYVPAEEKWLAMEKQYMDRWDFKLFMPWYIKQGSGYQYEMYAAYRTDAANMVGILDHPEVSKSMGADNPAREKLDAAKEHYFDFYEKTSGTLDWRARFFRVPLPEVCTPETLTIPETGGSIDWDRGSPSTPSGIPIDPRGILV